MISSGELEFVKYITTRNQRIDSRKFNEERLIEIKKSDIPQTDGSIEIRSGNTYIQINLRFVETEDSFKKLEIETDSQILHEKYISDIYLLDFDYFVCDFGIQIEVLIYSDDGGLLKCFYYGLDKLFKDLKVPFIDEDGNIDEKNVDTDVLVPDVIGVWNDVIFVDPNKLESELCTDIINVFSDDKYFNGIIFEKSSGITVDKFIEIINNRI